MLQETNFDTNFLIIKYGLFVFAGFVGSVGSLAFTPFENKIVFLKSLLLSVIMSVVVGVSLMSVFKFDIEFAFVASIFVSMFALKITKEVLETLDSVNDLSKKYAEKKIDTLVDEKNDQTEYVVSEEEEYNNSNTKLDQ